MFQAWSTAKTARANRQLAWIKRYLRSVRSRNRTHAPIVCVWLYVVLIPLGGATVRDLIGHFSASSTLSTIENPKAARLLSPMANLIRRAKSGSDWTDNDLAAYNITVVGQDTATFFCRPASPQPALNPELLTHLNAEEMQDDECYKLVRYMDLAMNPIPGEESAR